MVNLDFRVTKHWVQSSCYKKQFELKKMLLLYAWQPAMVLHRLNAQQSDNFKEFLQNALSQPPEGILSSFRIAKR